MAATLLPSFQVTILDLQDGKLPGSLAAGFRMQVTEDDPGWDFAPVYDLLHQLSISAEDNVAIETSSDSRAPSGHSSEDSGPSSSSSVDPFEAQISNTSSDRSLQSGLGNFDKLWEYLGQANDVAPPSIPAHVPSIYPADEDLGFTHNSRQRDVKAVKWRDEIDGADLADNDGVLPALAQLTKKQRKKANRKQRALLGSHLTSCINVASSENESEEETRIRSRARQAALNRDAAKADRHQGESDDDHRRHRSPDRKDIIQNMLYGAEGRPPTTAKMLDGGKSLGITRVHQSDSTRATYRASSEPVQTAYAVAASRKTELVRMLKERFPEERQYLNDTPLIHKIAEDEGIAPEGVHVFVDASNILIGFHDALRAARSLPREHRMRRQPISFHSLSLLFTRGRPTARLVLAGSDSFPAILEAKTIGYETNILDRVHKAKEITPRQRYFMNSNGNGNHTQSAGSGSETGPAAAEGKVWAPEKWVEQAVDEILHLKMMESVIDAVKPSTMVLASGDAAEAEYSGGFLKMLERALSKGWHVEVCCFKANASKMYRRKEFREKWGKRFRLVELDDFVEVLQGIE